MKKLFKDLMCKAKRMESRMKVSGDKIPPENLGARAVAMLVIGAAISFQLAYTVPRCSFLIIVYLWCLVELTWLKTSRLTSYVGLLVGLLAFAPQLNFFWNIFGPAAIALWLVMAFWLRMFLVLARACRIEFGRTCGLLLLPFLWTGFEYFRSELYYLRFTWLTPGFAFANSLSLVPMGSIGVYGMGFLLMLAVSVCSLLGLKRRLLVGATLVVGLALLTNLPKPEPSIAMESSNELQVAGAQLEFPDEARVLSTLNKLVKQYPQAQLLVLSEYTFAGPLPESVKKWCQKNQRYLIVGAEDRVSTKQYFNTAFVIGTNGDIVFRQAKSVPIQFFADGLPAKQQTLWSSPWGKIGLCICYDLSYSRVIDRLARLGAQAIIVPTMDVADWGRHQHELHARVAPTRAAEYGIPIFRLASSGISQCVNAFGEVTASTPMPGDGAMIFGTLHLARAASLPWDRVLAPICVFVTAVVTAWLAGLFLWRKRTVPIKTNPT